MLVFRRVDPLITLLDSLKPSCLQPLVTGFPTLASILRPSAVHTVDGMLEIEMLGLMSYLKFHPSNTCEAKRLMSARCSISWHIQVEGENIRAWINLHPPICIAGTPRSEIRMWYTSVEEASNLHFHLCICLTFTICVQHIACIMHVESYNKCKYEWCNIICIYTCTRTLCNYTQLHWNCRLQMTVGMSVPAQLCQCHKGVQRNRFHSYTESEKCCQQGQSKEVLDFEIDMLNHQLHRIHWVTAAWLWNHCACSKSNWRSFGSFTCLQGE